MMKLLSIPLLFATSSHALSTPMADPSAARSINPGTDFKGGAGVGRLVFDGDDSTPVDKWECKYDMVLVERLQGRPKTDTGLFVPQENLPKLHLCQGMYVIFIDVYYIAYCILYYSVIDKQPNNILHYHNQKHTNKTINTQIKLSRWDQVEKKKMVL